MPLSLQDKCTFSLLGYCGEDISGNGQSEMTLSERGTRINSIDSGINFLGNQSLVVRKNGSCVSGCHKVDALLEQFRLAFVQGGNWFQLEYNFPETTGQKLLLIPEVHHLQWNGETISQLDLHVCKSWLSVLFRISFLSFVFVVSNLLLCCEIRL